MLTHYEKCKNWSVLGGYGSPKVIGNSQFDRAHMSSYSTLIETTVYVYLVPFSSYSAFFVERTNFNSPHLHLSPQ